LAWDFFLPSWVAPARGNALTHGQIVSKCRKIVLTSKEIQLAQPSPDLIHLLVSEVKSYLIWTGSRPDPIHISGWAMKWVRKILYIWRKEGRKATGKASQKKFTQQQRWRTHSKTIKSTTIPTQQKQNDTWHRFRRSALSWEIVIFSPNERNGYIYIDSRINIQNNKKSTYFHLNIYIIYICSEAREREREWEKGKILIENDSDSLCSVRVNRERDKKRQGFFIPDNDISCLLW